MKKVVYRRKACGGPIRVFIYDQGPWESLGGGTRKDFVSGNPSQDGPSLPGRGRMRLHDTWLG